MISQQNARKREEKRKEQNRNGFWQINYAGGEIYLNWIDNWQQQENDKYDSFDASVSCESYNCAGLALRNYKFMSYSDLVNVLENNNLGTSGKAGDVKIWLWTYDIHIELEDGTVLSKTRKDFHVVGGRISKTGVDPKNIYSKNGARPVFGPDIAVSWKPSSRSFARSNNKKNEIATHYGQRIVKIRSNIKLRTFIIPYKIY